MSDILPVTSSTPCRRIRLRLFTQDQLTRPPDIGLLLRGDNDTSRQRNGRKPVQSFRPCHFGRNRQVALASDPSGEGRNEQTTDRKAGRE
jgi:hypothetical protein